MSYLRTRLNEGTARGTDGDDEGGGEAYIQS